MCDLGQQRIFECAFISALIPGSSMLVPRLLGENRLSGR
jgi:hypothetical protein